MSSKTDLTTQTIHVEQTSEQNIIDLGVILAGTRLSFQCKNIENTPTGTWMFNFRGTTWTDTNEHVFDIAEDGDQKLYTNIAPGVQFPDFNYDVQIKIIGESQIKGQELENTVNTLTDTVNIGEYIEGNDTDEVTISKILPLGNVKSGTLLKLNLSNVVSNVTDWSNYGWNIQIRSVIDNKRVALLVIRKAGFYEFPIENDVQIEIFVNVLNITLSYSLSYIIERGYLKTVAENVEKLTDTVGIKGNESFGIYSETQVTDLYKFDTFKTTRNAATTQQINHIGVLPAGTKVRLVIHDFKVISGNGYCIHYISKKLPNGMGYSNLSELTYSGISEVTLSEEMDIYTISNIGPNTAVSYNLICQYGSALPPSSIDTYIAVLKDTIIKEDGIIKSIHINVPNAGQYTFGVGTLDWRPIALVSKTFDLDLNAGEQVVVIENRILVRSGEKVFLYINKNGSDGLACANHSVEGGETFLIGKELETLTEYNGDGYGGNLMLEVSCVSLDSVFAFKEDMNVIENNIVVNSSSIQDLTSSLNVVRDSTGKKYELMVVNGVVTPIAMQYSKALVMGNSLSLGMDRYNNPYGMLATKANMDYVSHILSALQDKDVNATIYKEVSSYNLERDMLNTDFDAMFTSITTWDFDLIVYQGGENVNASQYANYQQALTNLMLYLKVKCPTAKFVITGVVLADFPILELAAKNAAKNVGAKYVYCNGHTSDVTIGVSNIWYNKIDDRYEPSDYTKQTHPNDLGFLNLANLILRAIGYSEISKSHNIIIENATVNHETPKLGVEGGIVTIKTYAAFAPNIVVRDGSNLSLQVNHYKLSDFTYDNRLKDGTTDLATYASTFDMPNGDVTVTIN